MGFGCTTTGEDQIAADFDEVADYADLQGQG